MKSYEKYFILFLALTLTSLVLLLNTNIFLKEGEYEVSGFENISEVRNSITISSKDNTNLNKNISQKKDSVKSINYLDVHYEALLVDTHNDFIWKVFDKGAVFAGNSFTQSDLPRFRAGGLDVQVFAVWIPMNKLSKSYSFVTSQIDRLKNIEIENSGDLEFATNYDDIIRITNGKKICGLIGIEGGTAIENNLDNINAFFEMGVRYIGLAWNNTNAISTSARDAVERGRQGGLTEFGVLVVKRMNEVGMLVDVSHLSEEGFWDVIENSTSPIIASHSNCYSLNPHFRNLTDEQIKAIAENGGYIGINFHDKFLDKDADTKRTMNAYEKFPDELNALNEQFGDDLIRYNEERDKFLSDNNILGGTTIEKVIEHIDYIKNLVGVDYVGIGSDFDGGITPPNELYDASTYPLITKKLVEKGYTEEEIKKVLGGNFLRVFKKVCG